MRKNLLVTLANKDYVQQAKQLFSSAYFNAGWDGDFMLLAYDIPEKDLHWFRKKNILVKKCKPIYPKRKIKKLYEKSALSDDYSFSFYETAITKFYLFTPEFKKWRVIIYLDSDIIVRASLDNLKKIKGFAAVRDSLYNLKSFFKESRSNSLYNRLKDNYNLHETVFNSGFFVFNTRIIKKKTFSQIVKLFEQYNSVSIYADQSALNLFFYKNWTRLPSIYNLCPPYLFRYNNIFGRLFNIGVRCVILHSASCPKFWHKDCVFFKEWKNNLEKAEQIGIKKPNVRRLTKVRIVFYYLAYLVYRSFFFLVPIDRFLGLIGIFLKKNFPGIYSFIKKIKD